MDRWATFRRGLSHAVIPRSKRPFVGRFPAEHGGSVVIIERGAARGHQDGVELLPLAQLRRGQRGHARLRLFHGAAHLVEGLAGQRPRAAEGLQRQPRVAQRAADPQLVARPRAAAQQGLADVSATTYAVTGAMAHIPPADVAGLGAVAIPGAVRIKWTANTERDYAVTELRRGASWAAGVALDGAAGGSTEVAGSTTDWAWPPSGTYTILARHRDTTGNLSAGTARPATRRPSTPSCPRPS